jgi:hypothetical protein
VPEYLEAAAKSMEGEELATFEEACRETYDRMARISIVPDWARYCEEKIPTWRPDIRVECYCGAEYHTRTGQLVEEPICGLLSTDARV